MIALSSLLDMKTIPNGIIPTKLCRNLIWVQEYWNDFFLHFEVE